jgi:two-component system, LytTR family, response regulator
LKVLIADDDMASRKILRFFIQKLPGFKIIGVACDGEELIDQVVKEKPDLVLVDIRIPLLNGMDVIKSCLKYHSILQVIFITGSTDHALEAFSVRAIDYILKPIDRIRLYSALDRASKSMENYKNNSPKKDLMIKQQGMMVYIPLHEIIFIERLDRKSVIYTSSKQYETNESLSNLEKLLDCRFLLSHRSYIINMEHLRIIETSGQSYKAIFNNFNKTAKLARNKVAELHRYKSI